MPLLALLLALASPLFAPLFLRELPRQQGGDAGARAELQSALEKEGIGLDLERGIVSVPAKVLVREELLEYLLVGPNGATHESLFLTESRPSLVNAALLLLGVEPGRNAHWEEREGGDSQGPLRKRADPPQGDGFLLYAGWREAGESFFFRVEDLLANYETGRSLRRHRWVFLGSRFATLHEGGPEVFMADVEGNLINLSFFFQGNTLLTAALEECVEQTIWAANAWLVPPRGQPVLLFFSRAPIAGLDPVLEARLPEVKPEPPSTEGER